MEVQVLAGDRILQFVLEGTSTVGALKKLVFDETRVAEAKQNLYFKGQLLADNTQTLTAAGVKHQEMLEMRSGLPSAVVAPNSAAGAASASSSSSASGSTSGGTGGGAKAGAATRTPPRPVRATLDSIPPQLFQNPPALQNYIRSNPDLVEQLMRVNPTMAEAVMADTPHFLTQILNEQAARRRQAESDEFRRVNALNSDPFNLEAQAKIAEDIRMKNVEENLSMAMEYNPEAFGRVVMLYVPMIVNKVPICAFVDSGAQSTIMSVECAKRCNLDRLIDRRYAGTAVGVGTAKIVGRVHAAVLQVGTASLTCSFTILDNQGMEFLFGLDMLKKFQACIDLKDNALKIAGQSIPFLSEKDIPKSEKEAEEVHSPTAHPKPKQPASASAASAAASKPTASASGGSGAKPATSPASAPAATSSGSGAKSPASASASASSAASTPKLTPSSGGAAAPTLSAAPKPAASGAAQSASSSSAAANKPATTASSSASGGGSGSAAPSSGAAAAAARPAGPPTSFPEASITAVMNVGANRQQAISALKMYGGNVEAAAAFIFQTMGGGMGF